MPHLGSAMTFVTFTSVENLSAPSPASFYMWPTSAAKYACFFMVLQYFARGNTLF